MFAVTPFSKSLPTRTVPSRAARLAAAAIGGSLLIAVAAHLKVPFWPVPLTLQTLAVLGLGAALGSFAAAAAVLAWIIEGVAGLPVFAAGTGPAMLLGPTAGYILGFLPAALIAGLVARRGRRVAPLKALTAFLAADAIVFAAGVAWLATFVGWDRAIAGGLTPFLLGEALKIGLLTAGTALLGRSAPRT
jgi:biotin transport system substrate-specific component